MNLAGVFPPVTTPFRDGGVDSSALRSNLERWQNTGVLGFVVLGSNGEAPQLDEEEADEVITAARDAVSGDRLLVAGTGRESTRATIGATRRAALLGADAVLVRTPSFFKSQMTTDVLVAHYQAVAEASPVPVLLYNFTAVTGINMQPEAVMRLAGHPNIIGVKESGGDVAQIAALVDHTPADFAVLAGSATTFYPSLCVGACGGILALACLVPELCVRLMAFWTEGRHREARDLQRQLAPLARLISTGHGVPGLKAALDLAGFHGGDPRPPLRPAPDSAVTALHAELHALQQLR